MAKYRRPFTRKLLYLSDCERNMHDAADGQKRKRFELLLQQAELPTEWLSQHFQDGYIDKWKSAVPQGMDVFYRQEALVPRSIYVGFIGRVKRKLGHIADIRNQ